MAEQVENGEGDDRSSDDPLRRAHVARELQAEAVHSFELGEVDAGIAATDQLIDLFAQEPDGSALAEIADSLVAAASTLAWTRRSDRSVMDEALARLTTFGRSLLLSRRSASGEHPPDRDRRRRLEQALKIDDALIVRLGESADRELHRVVIEAKINRCGSLLLLGHVKRSARLFDDLLEHPDPAYADIANRDTTHVERQIARALLRAHAGDRPEDV